MNRLSPLISRKPRALLLSPTLRFIPWDLSGLDEAEAGRWLDEIRLFATGWVGGLIFFGTYLS